MLQWHIVQPLGMLKLRTHRTAPAQKTESGVENVIDVLRLLVSIELDLDNENIAHQGGLDVGMLERRDRSDTRRMHTIRAAQSLSEAIGYAARTFLNGIDTESIAQAVSLWSHVLRIQAN